MQNWYTLSQSQSDRQTLEKVLFHGIDAATGRPLMDGLTSDDIARHARG